MSDMRDFTPSNDIRAESAFVDSGVVRESYVLEESGGMGGFHHPDVEEEGTGRNKVIGALVLALMLGGAGVYAYSMWPQSNEVVADENLPQPTAPRTAAITPMAPPPAATTPADESMAEAPTATAMSAPTAPDVVKPAPRTTQERVANAPRVTPLPQSSTPLAAAPSPATIAPPQVSVVPEPVSPTPPASAVAGNPPLNEQSAPAEAEPVTPPAEAAPPPQPEPAPLDQSQ